jgi:hypothetical protein
MFQGICFIWVYFSEDKEAKRSECWSKKTIVDIEWCNEKVIQRFIRVSRKISIKIDVR